MKVLVACEESQRVCIAFRERGHEAYSCDLEDCSGGHPEWHIKGDALLAIMGWQVVTVDGVTHDVGNRCYCLEFGGIATEDDFCSRGARKDYKS